MYGINYKIKGIGNLEVEYKAKTLHEVKAKAGKAFHNPNVTSVCVFDEEGQARLYLKRVEGGYHREER